MIDTHEETSNYTLDLPNSPNIFPTFHASQLSPYIENDAELFPDCELPKPGLIDCRWRNRIFYRSDT
jgi:hypothetical protein